MPATIVITAPKAPALLEAIKAATTDGTVATWVVDDQGDFVHGSISEGQKTPQGQWVHKAWLRPTTTSLTLTLKLLKPKSVPVLGQDVEGVYVGRFIEMMVNHFQGQYTNISVQ